MVTKFPKTEAFLAAHKTPLDYFAADGAAHGTRWAWAVDIEGRLVWDDGKIRDGNKPNSPLR
jgi:hypothetical protein